MDRKTQAGADHEGKGDHRQRVNDCFTAMAQKEGWQALIHFAKFPND
ncbi:MULTISPECIES: hypothetical protein [unclassified Afipia]|nr:MULTISPECIES: hypothetical protein [unclassified Afipia]